MRVAVTLEQRFSQTPDKAVWTPVSFAYPFWARYLSVFTDVRVIARVQVVTDPYDAFVPGAIQHPLRPVLRHLFTRALRAECARACAASYVTAHALQKRYPCPAFMIGVSDVELGDGAFVAQSRPPIRRQT